MSERLATFLEEFGLSQFYDSFLREQIELEDVVLLSDTDLAALGLPLGPRRRLQEAARGLKGAAPDLNERRNLTVLFCDMCDSTRAAATIDPEDLRARYQGFHEACSRVIQAEDGFAAQRFGDGVLAYFGFPKALEDAASCAVRAGLEIITTMQGLALPGGEVLVRVGIASGLTVIEQATGSAHDKDEIATGATLTLAARLQSIAKPSEVLVSDATRALSKDRFELQSIGPKTLKGFPDKQVVWRATGLAEPAQMERNQSGLFGRDRELARLISHLKSSAKGQAHAVLIEGEPGIGKSRLLQQLRRVAEDKHEVISLHSVRHRQRAGLHAITQWLLSYGASLDRLSGVTAQNRPLLQRIMGLKSEPSDIGTDSSDLLQDIQNALLDVLVPKNGKARVLLLEDLHWADVQTIELLERLALETSRAPLLMVATTRPEAEHLPAGFEKMVLAPLGRGDADKLITEQKGALDLSQDVRDTIAERAGGVPLFVEELTRSVLETEIENRSAVPLTLQDVLMARLDRLSAGKTVAQIGALMGTEFTKDLLVASGDLTQAFLDKGLLELVRANLLQTQGQTYKFRHALVRDVAYGSLLHSQRKLLHARVADTIKTQFPTLAQGQPERVADHYTQAEDPVAALPFWSKAAEDAVSRAAPASAISYFQNALSCLSHQPASDARDDQEVALRLRLNMPLTTTSGFASSETEANLSALAAFFETMEPSEAALQLLWSRAMSALVNADLVSARKTAQQLERAAQRARVPNTQRLPSRMLGYVAMLEGDLTQAETHFEHVFEGYAPDAFDPILPGHPFDMLASSLAQRAILMAMQNKAEALDRDQEAALARLNAFDNPATSFQVLVHLCLARFELGDYDGVLPLLTDLRALVNTHQIAPLYVEIWEAWMHARNDLNGPGLEDMERALNNPAQYPLWLPRSRLLAVELLIKAGRQDAALAALDACDAEINTLRHWYLRKHAKHLRNLLQS